jgi:hypothetical protein
VGVPVLAPLAQSPDDDVVAVESRVVGALDYGAGGDGRQRRAAAGGDVEALVAPAAVPRSVEFTDRAAGAVCPPHWEEVAVKSHPPGLLLGAAGECDDDLVGAVGDRRAALCEPVPALDQILVGRRGRDLDGSHLLAGPKDPDCHVGGR